jgi:hypothetical protein
MKQIPSFSSVFRRAATFFPSPGVTIEAGPDTLKPDSFCTVSFDPPVVAITLGRSFAVPPEFSIAIAPVKLECSLLEAKEIGDRTLHLAAVQRLEIRGGPPPAVNWRRASYRLHLDYPFLAGEDALDTFVHHWRTGVLPKNAWTHAAHVAVTGYHAFDHSPDDVFTEMKRGIVHFNSCTGVVDGPDSGYHETLTRFWSNTISHTVRDARPDSRLDAANYAVRLFGEDRDLASLYYSFDVVRDRRARREWVNPDLEPLPEWRGGGK